MVPSTLAFTTTNTVKMFEFFLQSSCSITVQYCLKITFRHPRTVQSYNFWELNSRNCNFSGDAFCVCQKCSNGILILKVVLWKHRDKGRHNLLCRDINESDSCTAWTIYRQREKGKIRYTKKQMTRVLFANSATAVLRSIMTAVEQAGEWIMPESWTCSTIQWESDSVCVIGHWLHLFSYSPLVCAIRHRCANDHSLFSFDSVALHRCSRSACFPPARRVWRPAGCGLTQRWLIGQKTYGLPPSGKIVSISTALSREIWVGRWVQYRFIDEIQTKNCDIVDRLERVLKKWEMKKALRETQTLRARWL